MRTPVRCQPARSRGDRDADRMLDPRSAFAEASANGGDGNTKLLGQLSVRGASFAAVTQLGECLRFSQTSFAARPTELDAYVDLKRRLVCEVPVGADFGS